MPMKYLILLISLTSCGPCKHVQVLDIEFQYQQYINSFEEESVKQKHQVIINDLIVITVEKLGTDIIARCHVSYLSTSRIEVSKEQWDILDDAEKEESIFHELGHCILHRGHTSKRDELGVPTSIMYPYMIPGSMYLWRKNELMQELFSNS
jgi:hypothetical protein